MTTWKHAERQIAKWLNGRRVPVSGRHHIPHGQVSHDPAGHASRAVTSHSLYSDGDSDDDPGKPKNPHQNYEKTSRTPANPQGGFFSSRYTPNREEKKIPGETDFSHGEAKKASRTPDDLFSSRYTPMREEKKTDGTPKNPHQNCEKALHTPADHTSGSSDEPKNPHQNCEKALHTCVVCGQALLQVSGQSALYCSTACRVKAYRQRQSSANTPGQGDPVRPAVEKATDVPDPSVCLDCGQRIGAEGFLYRCPPCLQARYDKLGWQYPEKLVRWLRVHAQKEGR